MAETLISPGVLARENDQSFVTSQPVERGAAIVGPTVIGPVERPTLISSFSSYQALFGGALQSGSNEYTYLTSIAANQYFQNGGNSLLVTRVTSGSFSPAISTTIQNSVESTTGGLIGNIFSTLTGTPTPTGLGGVAATYNSVGTSTNNAGGGAELTIIKDISLGYISSTATITGAQTGGTGGATSVGAFTATPTVSPAGGTGLTLTVNTSIGDAFFPSTIADSGIAITSVTPSVNLSISIADLVADGAVITNGGSGGLVTLTSNGSGEISSITLTSGGTGWTILSTITINPATINNIINAPFGSTATGGNAVFTFATGNLSTAIDSVTAATQGVGYSVNDILTIAASDIGTPSSNLTISLATADFTANISSAIIVEDGSNYAEGDSLTVASSLIGGGADAVFLLTDASIENQTAFELETVSAGIIMNNTSPAGSDTSGTELPGGALASGSSDNLRWQITSVNTASGVFSLAIRRGNDSTNRPVVLEQYNNISLDPFSPNYISRAIGDISTNLVKEGADTFLQESGSFSQISSYVRVKSVKTPTPNYFNNDGSAKNQFTGSLPLLGSGSFDGAIGSNIPVGRAANFYQNINNIDSQGLVGSDYNDAIALLASQDEYQYNVISVPGLNNQDHASQITSVMNNAISRGDNIAVIDLVRYNQPINTVTTQAGGIDNSYTATYWPWLQTVDPNSGQLVYIPASTFIPGVYAFTDASSDPWFAPAGITRGGMGQVVRAERKLTSTNRDTLYEANVNPIATFPSQGVVVFGQKTLQKAASALDRVNVRRLLITLKGYISQIADNLVFEQNTIATRQNFLTQVNPYLESVQQRQGLYAFKVVMDESNNTPDVIDRNELIGQIFLQPTRTAEFIMLDFNVLPTGATFPA